MDLATLQKLNAGWNFAQTDATGAKRYPYREHAVRIPMLAEALRAIPASAPVFFDMKALPAAPQAAAVARVLIYSTDAAYQSAFAAYPRARLFESRDTTRNRLAGVTSSTHASSRRPRVHGTRSNTHERWN